jgi:PAS domain S-box-containing protein
MVETLFEEMKRYVHWGAEDEQALRALRDRAAPFFREIADDFYRRLESHEQARRVFSGPEQVERLKVTLCAWMNLLFTGPWDEAYYHTRARIGRMHVKIGLAQRYMFTAMDVIRISLQQIAQDALPDTAERTRAVWAIAKILDLELAIMLETYAEAFVDKVQRLERMEKDHLEHRLAISEARYGEIVENAWSLVSTFDENGTILLFNSRCEELTGVKRERAVGANWLEVCVTPDEHPQVQIQIDRLLGGQRAAPHEGRLPGSLSIDRRVRWHFTTLPSGGEKIVCAIGVDVTEERELQTRARRAERLAALGTMAAGLAHEIRNPLNAAALQLTLMQRRLSRPDGADVPGARNAAEIVSTELQRLATLVQDFLEFARPQPLKLQPSDVRELARGLVDLVGPEATAAGVSLTLAEGPSVFTQFDIERMKQVVLNVMRNAIEATGDGGRVVLRVHSDADGARIEVEDNGPGLATIDAPIFEPFFTTKSAGTGLGLAIAHRIVSDHGGKIGFESRPGRTVFGISLPHA